MSEYFVCRSCGNVQHTTEFGECAECGVEELYSIDGIMKNLLVPYIQNVMQKYEHEIDDEKAAELALLSMMQYMNATLPNVLRSYWKNESHQPRYRSGIFVIDNAEISYEGYTTGNTWNGFACPVFTKEVADKIVNDYNNSSSFQSAWYD